MARIIDRIFARSAERRAAALGYSHDYPIA